MRLAPVAPGRSVVYPSGLASPRGTLFNFDWITLVVMLAIVIIGGVYFVVARPWRRLDGPRTTPQPELAPAP